MFAFYIYFALLITHLSLFSTPTCYISFDQEPTQRCSYDKNLFHADQYKHSYDTNAYDTTANLLTYSASDFKNYFNYHHCAQEEILAHNQLYISDEFVRLIKTFSGYQRAVKKLYHKLNGTGKVCKFLRIGYSPQLFERISNLYKQIKCVENLLTKSGEQFAEIYGINLVELFPHNDSLSAQHMYQNYMRILNEASFISYDNTIIRNCIGQAAGIGFEANKNGHIKEASALADFCWNLIDLTKAFGEGICLGATNTTRTRSKQQQLF